MTNDQVKDISRLNELTPLHINPYNLGDMGETSKIIGRLFKSTLSSTTPSLNAGSLEEAAKEWANERLKDYENYIDPIVFSEEAIKDAFIAGAGYSKGGEENQDWPPNVWQLGNDASSYLHGKWAYAYRDNEGLNQHEYPFKSEQEAIDHYKKRFFPSRPSLDIDKMVEQMREENPYCGEIDFSEDARIAWEKSCDKLKELLNQKEEK